MKRNLTTLWMLLLMIIVGGGNVWADSFSIIASNYATTEALKSAMSSGISNGSVTVSFSNPGTDFQGDATDGIMTIKMRGGSGRDATISINTRSSAITVQQVVITYTGTKRTISSEGGSLTTNDDAKTYTFSYSPALAALSIVNSDGNFNIKRIDITYTDSRASLSPAFDYGKMEIHNTAGDQHTYVCGTPFVYEPSKDRLKVRITVTPRYSGIYGTISSSDETVLKTSDSSLTGPTAVTIGGNDGWEMYIDNIKVLKTGSATLRFWFNGNDDYKPTTLEIPITVIDHSITPFNNSYKYTWDFADGDWSSTIAQLGYGNGDGGYNWTKTVDGSHAEAKPTYHNWIPTYSGIDMISGLEFNMTNKEDLLLDWFEGRHSIWMNADATVTIPNLVKDQKITITADHDDYTITAGSATKSGNVITVTGNGSVTLKMAQATRIYSIAVSNSQYGWSYTTETRLLYNDKTGSAARPVKGTFTFTDEGPLAGGTVIKEVPGIELTVGATGQEWSVVYGWGEGNLNPDFYKDASHFWNLGYVSVRDEKPNSNNNPTSGCFYTFDAKVNGQVTIHYYTLSEAKIYKNHNSSSYAHNNNSREQTLTFTVEAGNTYTLTAPYNGDYRGLIWLHSFSFEPKFFQPGTTTLQLSNEAALVERDGSGNITSAQQTTLEASAFNANMSTGKENFPKLIDRTSEAQQSGVKFADTDRKTYLYKNNDVDLLEPGSLLLIRGTVLDKNGDDGLVAYYYLNSNIISLKSTELEDQVYINSGGLTDDKYTFTYNGNVVASGGTLTVKVKKDTDAETDVIAIVNSYDRGTDQTTIDVPFASLEEGSTYRIRIPANTLQLSSDAAAKNSEVARVFSVNKDGEATVTMIYPGAVATVGTTIVLEVKADGERHPIFDNPRVKGILSAVDGGEEDMVISAGIATGLLYFKPPRTLRSNTEYTLTINTSENNMIKTQLKYSTNPDEYYKVTKNKAFTFKTGSSSGVVPEVVTYSPAENAINANYSSGEIAFTFNQEIELEPYSKVTATPVNGREATANAQTFNPGSESNTLKVKSDGKTVYFEYNADALRYDVYYEVVIPANTVIGAGGLPNSEPITLHFRMAPKPNSSCKVSSTAFTGYPYSWDFTKFGTLTSTISDLTDNAPDVTTGTSDEKAQKKATAVASRWQLVETNSYANYWTDSYDMEFPQGEVLTYRTATAETPEEVEMAEVPGLRWSLASRNSSGANKRVQIVPYGSGYCLKLVGGTHYMTIPEVGNGKKIYIRAQVSSSNVDSRFNINSDNAVFADNYRDGNNKLGVRDGSVHVYKVNVTGGGDVTFCLQDVSFYQIAVAVDDAKKFNDYGTSSYTTEYRPGSTERYDLTSVFTDGASTVTAMVPITATVTDEENMSGTLEMATPTAVPAKTPVILVCSSTGGPSVPLFAADINTETQAVAGNLLVGNDVPEKIYAPLGSYILTTRYCEIDMNGNPKGEVQTGELAFYRVYKANYNGITANKAYLKNVLSESGSGAKLAYFFIDVDEATAINRPSMESGVEDDDSSVYYNLSGLRINGRPTTPGIYIKNGKKLYVK